MTKIKSVAISALLLILFGMSVFILPVHAAATVSLGTSGYTETTITLTWSKSTDNLFSNYKLYYSTTGTNGPFNSTWSTSDESQTSVYVDGLTPNTNYWFYIKDTDLLGSANSNTFEVSTSNVPQLSATPTTSTTVNLQWNDYNVYSSLVPFSSYVIQMSTNGGSFSTLTTITSASQTTYTVTGLSPATYVFSMYDTVGTTGQYTYTSNEATAHIYTPVSVQITSSTTSANVGQQVQLTASASGGTNSYNYQWFANDNPIAGATSASYTYTPTDAGTINIYATAQDTQDSLLAIATSNSVVLTATASTQPTQTNTITNPSNPTPTNTNNSTPQSDNTMIYIVVMVIAIIVIVGAVAAVALKQKAPKKPLT